MKTVQMIVRVPPEVKRTMKLIALARGESLSETVRNVLREHITSSSEEIQSFARRYNNKK